MRNIPIYVLNPNSRGLMRFRRAARICGLSCLTIESAAMKAWIENWKQRHRHPVSFWLHVLAIPLLPIAAALAVIQLIDGRWDLWYRPVVLIITSYVIQGIGHWIEGNDMGEIILIKKALGKPYVAVAQREREAE